MDALQKLDDGKLILETPPDPRSGATSIALDPLEWIHRITSHIRDSGRHCQRFYGAYSNRARIPAFPTDAKSAGLPAAKPPEQNGFLQGSPQQVGSPDKGNLRGGSPALHVRGAHAHRFLYYRPPRRRPYPHRESERCKARDPFEPRAPPDEADGSPQ